MMPWYNIDGVGEAFYTQRQCSPTRVSYTQCTTDAYSNFLLISTPMEACYFPNPMGQMTYFISLFLTFVFFLFFYFFKDKGEIFP